MYNSRRKSAKTGMPYNKKPALNLVFSGSLPRTIAVILAKTNKNKFNSKTERETNFFQLALLVLY